MAQDKVLSKKELGRHMKYHDTGSKDLGHALAKWFEEILATDVAEFRMQSGYFRIDAVGAVSSVLRIAAEKNLKTHVVIGSNDNDTLYSEVQRLFLRMGMPRSEGRLAVVQFSNALFHPKVYHFTRNDGSQTAFVGSANFTSPGLTGRNVEAAISIDSRDGDSIEILNQIASAIDRWVIQPVLEGGAIIANPNDIDDLLSSGVLAENRPPRLPTRGSVREGAVAGSARRSKLITLPAWSDTENPSEQEDGNDAPLSEDDMVVADVQLANVIEKLSEQSHSAAEAQLLELDIPRETREGFPSYILFEPGAVTPTKGGAAMSGEELPVPSAAGLIMKLTKDSARHFHGGKGTANVSIPVDVIKTFRFGLYPESGRPRAEFALWIRYCADTLIIEREAKTNVMPYGFMPDETGHGDLRMIMPAAVKKIAEEVKLQEQPIPKEGNLFLLEWPTPGSDSFGLTFLAEGSELARMTAEIYQKAANSGTLIGGSSTWLPPDLAPLW